MICSNGGTTLDYTERFTAVLGPQSSQAEVFRVSGLPIVEATLSGKSTCLFAYGQTGSGKTFSMSAAAHSSTSADRMRLNVA
eukprot:7376426-Prymnesium_polylepis.2